MCREEDEDLDQSQMMANVFGGSLKSDRPRTSSTAKVEQEAAVGGQKTKKKKRWTWLGLR